MIVPDKYGKRKVHVGEFLRDVDFKVEIKMDRYGDEPLLARPVKWYPPIDEGSLPKTLTEKLRLPNPMSLLEKEEYKRVFDEVYKTYYTENEFCSRFYTKSQDFTTNDNLYFNALTRAISKLLLDADDDSTQNNDTFLELAFFFCQLIMKHLFLVLFIPPGFWN
ncbi:hypothetical protein [Acetobacter thailandicus]|uniref:Uncharacterized protein n=1 Tax=Acetobacter thailandicus TaxID=1502842 RepID=A0ABT3QDS1_9PROT|nr:hypothetical protein [Acetobacter thailandicus]MCX2563384.1 hypothetical protein [Acetobacter thailandicus]NHN94137.1 hypothetical protein [Acetobacter thailandicus]